MSKMKPIGIATTILVSGYLLSATAMASTPLVVDDLLTSSNLTTPWQVCGADSISIDVTNLDAGGCAYRTTPVEPGFTYSLSCGVVVSKYASITLAYLDADGTTIGDPAITEVFEHVSGAYSVSAQAPAGAVTAAIGIYGETGSGFQDCALINSTPPPEPTKGSITGVTWFDESADSIFDSNEHIVTGTPVTLKQQGVVLKQVHTNADGSYYFGNLDIDACYTVAFGSIDSTLELGAAGGDNDAGASGVSSNICLTELIVDVVDVDAAFVAVAPPEPPADYSISGHAWLDADANGRANSGDSMFENVVVNLLDGASNQLDTFTTTSNGKFVFNDLVAGDYQVQFIIPDGYEPTTNAGSPLAGRSYINDGGFTAVFNLPTDGNTSADSAITVEQVNGAFIKLPVALDPTIANDDEATQDVGTDFSIAILGNDDACDGVRKVNLLGHNVPGNVSFNSSTKEFDISNTTAAGSYSIRYGLRGVCGSLDTATVFVTLNELPIVVDPSAPDAPICRVETGGSTRIGGVDVFNLNSDGFASQYNMYDRDKNLVVTVSSDDYTHKNLIGNDANQWEGPWKGNYEIEWNGTAFGYDQVSVYYVAALESGLESELTECVRSLVSPIALDLNNKGRIQRIAGEFKVDLNGDGIGEALSQWFAPSAGILVNKNASGQVSGDDMYGNIPGVYTDGFAELRTLDVNDDGQLSNDELSGLAIWKDLNSDTIVDKSELSSLADHQIVSLALNHYKFMARAKKSNGSSILMEDVWLPHAPMAALTK